VRACVAGRGVPRSSRSRLNCHLGKTHYHIMYDDNFKFPETVWSLAIWVQRLSKTPIDPVDPSMNRQSRTD
jgi:hypothetical protein